MADYKEYVYAVYQEKSFSKAAKKLLVAQPWLSAAVKKTEQEINAPIFDRSTNPISLTEAGKYYIEHVEQILAIEKEMEQHFKKLHAAQETQLRIGSSMFFCTYVLPTLLEDFRSLYPHVSITFSEGNSQTLTEKLLNGELDFLLEAEKPENAKLTTIPWAEEEIILAVPTHYSINQNLSEYYYTFEEFLQRSHSNVCKAPVPLQIFQNEPFILLNTDNDIHRRSLQICQNAGFSPKVSLYLTQMMTAYYLVCEGRGIAFLRSTIPEYVMPTRDVVFYQLGDPLAVRKIYLSYPNRKATPVQQYLIDYMNEETSFNFHQMYRPLPADNIKKETSK